MRCLNCNKNGIKKGNKFCSKSCAATYNNKRRKHTIETKRKISSSLGGEGIAREERVCSLCGKKGISGKELCSDCFTPRLTPEAINISRLSFQSYEEEVGNKLSKIYGSLKKEIINNTAFDFCNDKYIIDFTFDYGKGTSDAIRRFEKLGNKDSRIKILYIPSKNVGQKRRDRVLKLGVSI